MFEEMTYETILKRMLERVSDSLDKREGSVIYDALAPAAVELNNMYIELEGAVSEVFADTSTREYLIKRASERGITPKSASKAVLKAVFSPTNINVMGERFNLEELNYVVVEKISDGIYKIECETEGSAGNRYFGTIIPINNIQGLETAEITEVLIPGEDEEDTEVFRQRYFDSLQSQAFGGNIADYKQKIKAIDGVGGVKVYRAEEWNGAGTVKLVIQTSEYKVPSVEFISDIQTQVDPLQNQGEGIGIAPIGHQVTVFGVNETEISLEADFEFADGYDFESVKPYVFEVLESYFEELNQNWENQTGIIVYSMQIGARLLNVQGILDISNIKINGESGNLQLDKDAVINAEEISINGVKENGTD